ncbi:MAG: tetratricopeptide repeat protein [Verrucomicrobiae bacterium]|nr:tetratricopeptide repeat protein [Verrucomicrobiae bacterium]
MRRILTLLCWTVGVVVASADDPKPLSVRDRAMAAWRAGNHTNAIALTTEVLTAEPKDSRMWHLRGQMRSLTGDRQGAADDFTEALRLTPGSPSLHQERAIVRFFLGQLTGAVADFDRANELDPAAAPRNWQRGLALFYAKRYDDGRKQFEIHRTVNPNDVENAVWHYACVARTEGLEAARAQLMPIRGDSRIPMAEVHDLFAGTGDEEDVLEAAREASGGARERRMARFYAQLYLGLYRDLHGNKDSALDAMREAVVLALPQDYMGEVARIHLRELEPPKANAESPDPSAPKISP